MEFSVEMKFSKYNILVERDGEIVLYNSLRQNYVIIDSEPEFTEFKNLIKSQNLIKQNQMSEALYQRGYIVDDSVDEYELAKNVIKDFYKQAEQSFYVMIFLTEQCNFRCKYCSQEHTDKKISDEILNSIYKHIKKNVKNNKYKQIALVLFGGEPLLELTKLLPFLEKIMDLKQEHQDLDIRHRITTNGYLLTPENYNNLVKNGVKYYQITLDGFAETHDKARPRVDGAGTWDKIIENLKYINSINDDADIQIRINYNHDNEQGLIEFLDWLQKEFKNPKFNYDICPITQLSPTVDVEQIGRRDSEQAFEAQLHVYQNAQNQIKNSSELSTLVFACKCANPNFYSIRTTGEVSKCEHLYDDSSIVGYINCDGDFELDSQNLHFFEDCEIEECSSCILYPLCGARGCPMKGPKGFCSEEYKERTLNWIIDCIKSGSLLTNS